MRLFFSIIYFLFFSISFSQSKSAKFQFLFEGKTLDGVLNVPQTQEPRGIVLFVHGSGRTNAVAQNWYSDIRQTLNQNGYTTYMWDKMGCGNSEGVFNYNQSVQNSALEVLAAITALKKSKIEGAENIGFWGISRAGWIIPLVINQYPDTAFWISASGVDSKENFKYLLQENLKIKGRDSDYVELIVNEWQNGLEITHKGGSIEKYLKATQNLRKSKFLLRFNNNQKLTEVDYKEFQQTLMKQKLDEDSGLPIYINNFDKILKNISCPVLALFGETDKNVDWKKTKELYQQTLERNTDLTIISFKNCNHNLFQCKTGGFFEFEDDNLPWVRCENLLEEMSNWLRAL
ncbi:MAG: alpha/beta hydrolase [Bacteroidota bacterium]